MSPKNFRHAKKEQEKVFNRESIPKWIAGAGILLMGASLFATTKLAYTHSDNAWYAIMGRDIAAGNILLTNFVGSTMSHYFPYALIESFWSLFFRSYRDVHALSVVSLTLLWGYVVFLAIQGLSGKKPSIFHVLTIVVFIITMHPPVLAETYVHFAPALCALLAAYLYYSKHPSKWAKYGIVALLATWTNNYNIIYFLIPILLENILYYIKTKKTDPMLKWVALGMVVYVVRYLLLMNIGLEIPGAASVLKSARIISDFDNIGDNFSKVYFSLNTLFSSHFWGMKLERALPSLYFSIALFLTLYAKAKYSLQIYKEKSSDENRLMMFLLIGSFAILGIHLFSKITASMMYLRYMAGFYINGLVILGYWLHTKWPTGNKLSFIFVVTLVTSIVYQINHERYQENPFLKERQEIANIIRDENLNNGYAWFGNALSTNFILNEQRVASLRYKSSKPMLWLIDRKTFHRPGKFDFILAWKDAQHGEWGEYDWSDEEIREYFGAPEKTIETGRIRVYVYDDITDKVEKPKLKAFGFFK